jgi:hypothetical protein
MQKICDGFGKSSHMNEIQNDIRQINDSKAKDESTFISAKKISPYKSSVFTQFKWLTWRNALGVIRNPMTSRIQVLQAVVSIKYFFKRLTQIFSIYQI